MGVEPGYQEGPGSKDLGRVLVPIKNTRFVGDDGTNQTKEGYRGQKAVSLTRSLWCGVQDKRVERVECECRASRVCSLSQELCAHMRVSSHQSQESRVTSHKSLWSQVTRVTRHKSQESRVYHSDNCRIVTTVVL